MKYSIERELDDQEIEDIITTALESGYEGIGYWACLLNDDEEWESSRRSIEAVGKTPYWSTVMLHVLRSGGAVRFQDAEDLEEGEIWAMTWDKFVLGCKMYEEKQGVSIKKQLEDGNFDANEADILFQYALFSDIIYG